MAKIKVCICAYCNVELTQYNIGMHVKKYHNVDPVQYKIDHGITKTKEQLKMDKIKKGIIRTADTIIKSTTFIGTIDDCSSIDNTQRALMIELLTPYISCKSKGVIVDCNIKYIARCIKHWSHLDITQLRKKYKEMFDIPNNESYNYYMGMFGDHEYAIKQINIKSERVIGDKNPAYQHAGKYSPFSKNFIYYDEDTRQAALKMAQNNREYTSSIDYYISRGMSHDDALIALSDRQNTVGLDKYISRLGVELGTIAHKKRTNLWQATLNSKSPEDKLKINASKSSPNSFCKHTYNLPNQPAILYFVEMECIITGHKFYKVGATTRNATKRFSNVRRHGIKLTNVILESTQLTVIEIAKLEDEIHKILRSEVGIMDIGRRFDGWTECYNLDEYYYNLVHKFISNIGGK